MVRCVRGLSHGEACLVGPVTMYHDEDDAMIGTLLIGHRFSCQGYGNVSSIIQHFPRAVGSCKCYKSIESRCAVFLALLILDVLK